MPFWAALAAGAKAIGGAAVKAAPYVKKTLDVMAALKAASAAGGGNLGALGSIGSTLRPEEGKEVGAEMTSKVLDESLKSAKKPLTRGGKVQEKIAERSANLLPKSKAMDNLAYLGSLKKSIIPGLGEKKLGDKVLDFDWINI